MPSIDYVERGGSDGGRGGWPNATMQPPPPPRRQSLTVPSAVPYAFDFRGNTRDTIVGSAGSAIATPSDGSSAASYDDGWSENRMRKRRDATEMRRYSAAFSSESKSSVRPRPQRSTTLGTPPPPRSGGRITARKIAARKRSEPPAISTSSALIAAAFAAAQERQRRYSPPRDRLAAPPTHCYRSRSGSAQSNASFNSANNNNNAKPHLSDDEENDEEKEVKEEVEEEEGETGERRAASSAADGRRRDSGASAASSHAAFFADVRSAGSRTTLLTRALSSPDALLEERSPASDESTDANRRPPPRSVSTLSPFFGAKVVRRGGSDTNSSMGSFIGGGASYGGTPSPISSADVASTAPLLSPPPLQATSIAAWSGGGSAATTAPKCRNRRASSSTSAEQLQRISFASDTNNADVGGRRASASSGGTRLQQPQVQLNGSLLSIGNAQLMVSANRLMEQYTQRRPSVSSAHSDTRRNLMLLQNVGRTLQRTHNHLKKTRLLHAFYLLALPVYTLFGAFIFQALDGDTDDHLMKVYDLRCRDEREWRLEQIRKGCVRASNGSATSATAVILSACFDEMAVFLADVEACYRRWHAVNKTMTHPMSDFTNAVIYAFSVYTTIGYGTISASTVAARIATVIYGAFGIPLFFAFIKEEGNQCRMCFIWLYNWVKRWRRRQARLARATRNAPPPPVDSASSSTCSASATSVRGWRTHRWLCCGSGAECGCSSFRFGGCYAKSGAERWGWWRRRRRSGITTGDYDEDASAAKRLKEKSPPLLNGIGAMGAKKQSTTSEQQQQQSSPLLLKKNNNNNNVIHITAEAGTPIETSAENTVYTTTASPDMKAESCGIVGSDFDQRANIVAAAVVASVNECLLERGCCGVAAVAAVAADNAEEEAVAGWNHRTASSRQHHSSGDGSVRSGNFFYPPTLNDGDADRREGGGAAASARQRSAVEQRRVFISGVVVFIVYLLLVSLLFSVMADWDFFTAFYFLFNSVALIGFGDVFPNQASIILVNMFFIVMGVVLFSMCYFILQEEIRVKAFEASRRARMSISKYSHSLMLHTKNHPWSRRNSPAFDNRAAAASGVTFDGSSPNASAPPPSSSSAFDRLRKRRQSAPVITLSGASRKTSKPEVLFA